MNMPGLRDTPLGFIQVALCDSQKRKTIETYKAIYSAADLDEAIYAATKSLLDKAVMSHILPDTEQERD